MRLAWFAAGPFGLVIFGLLIAQRGTFSVLDLAYWLTVVLIAVVRWIDITRFGGSSSEGTPATLGDWRRHVVLLVLVGGSLWGLIHLGWRWFGA